MFLRPHDMIRKLLLGFLVMSCAKPDDDSKAGSTSGGSETSSSTAPTTGTSASTADNSTAVSGESEGMSGTGSTDGSGSTGASGDDVCGPFAAHYVECFSEEDPDLMMIEMLCEHDIASALEQTGQECSDAVKAYFECLSKIPCEVFGDSCTTEAMKRIDLCGG